MSDKKLITRITLSHAILIGAALLSSGYLTGQFFKDRYFKDLKTELGKKADITVFTLQEILKNKDISKLQDFCRISGERAKLRYTVIASDGVVLCDSRHDRNTMDNHQSRPEIEKALNSGQGHAVRWSDTRDKHLFYLAKSFDAGYGKYVVRVSEEMKKIHSELKWIYLRIFIVGIVILALAFIFSSFISLKIVFPITEMNAGVESITAGNLDIELEPTGLSELEGLRKNINTMARELKTRIETVTYQRNELETILANMNEAVIAIDADEEVLKFNSRAAELFSLDPEIHTGRPVRSLIRNVHVHEFIVKLLDSEVDMECEIAPGAASDGHFLLRGSTLRGKNNWLWGAILVFTDITRLKKLENIRREFVANVSHELKTPLTSIRGYVETVVGELDDRTEIREFLIKALNQTERLNNIIEDLLALSRIEEGEKAKVLTNESLGDIINCSIASLESAAKEKNIRIEVPVKSDTLVPCIRNLLEQAFINVLGNAIRYGNENSAIIVSSTFEKGTVTVSIKDEGPGIAPEHLERIFERFYRVDKARSRKLGGTGLGLAIVKHIMKLHSGSVRVESQLGKGSVFYITIPAQIP
ncbi:PAS domain-containing protein [Myxococcota bacterium]|nr:PAS domain-containing protein [Myxococcota bacterium]MBU1379499.1 PAS domain-containing protein [Myxococcota bacterium]MBU1497906.1 PAS domain-containing protein [Myxococcota bacterium]